MPTKRTAPGRDCVDDMSEDVARFLDELSALLLVADAVEIRTRPDEVWLDGFLHGKRAK